MNSRTLQTVASGVLITLAFSGCSSNTEVIANDAAAVPDETPAPAAAPTIAPKPTIAPEPTNIPAPTATTPPAPNTPTATPVPAPLPTSVTDLPGEPWDLYVPIAGEIVAVVGVAFDDILEVHQGPGENTPLLGTLAPLADDVVSAGEGRALSASIWWRVTQGDLDGWVGSRFMSRLGATNDITSQIVESLGAIPSAETMIALAMTVAATRASDEPPSRIVTSAAPTVGDLGEITMDVVGFGDDAVEGERLRIFGQPLESGEGFSLKSVEATAMCSRGVTDSGLCL